MKKISLIVAIMATSYNIAYCQQHVITYYDAFKKAKHEDAYLDATGSKHGKYIEYNENGTIKEVANYVHGELNGKDTKYYDEIGMVGSSIMHTYGLASTLNYKNGVLSGLQQKYYDDDDAQIAYTKYVKVEEFYSNDTIKWKKTYDQDEKTGRRFLSMWAYYDNDVDKGPATVECYTAGGKHYAHAARNGRNWRIPNPPERPTKIEVNCMDGEMDGLYQEWFANGQLKNSCKYIKGKKDGIEKTFDEKGNLISSDTYLYGVLIEPK